MPRETIHTRHDQPFELKIGWSQDHDVQVGVEIQDGRSMFWQLLEWHLTNPGPNHIQLDEDLALHQPTLGNAMRNIVGYAATNNLSDEAIGRMMLNLLDCLCPMYKGLWTTFDTRRSCNETIAVMRKARDAAFGKDL